jgi:peptide/nickel transport system substrate-binding protein
MRLDPRSGAVTKTIHLGGSPTALVSAAGRVWVTVAPAPPPPPVTGGTAHFTMQDDFSSLDPALAPDPSAVEVMYATCANLVTYPDKPAPAVSQIVPEVAEAVPAPTDGGRTYIFTIRPGFRFSPPSNEAVTAQTFKATIERVASPRLSSTFASAFSGVVGYHDYVTGNAPGLSGVVARGDTLTITLSQPDGSFLANLAGGAACAVPPGTPAVPGLASIPSAGPYYVASYSPRQQLVLRRNPNYRGDRPHHLDQMVFTIGIDSARGLADIEAGTADYAVDGLPRDAGPRLESQYGPGSKAARAGHQQYFISPANGVRILHMNTSRPLFSNVRLRRAVSYAIDRAALAAQGQRFAEVNPFNAGSPADSYLPPATAGAADFHLYPLAGPDLRRARQLAGNVHATAIMYTPNYPPWLQEAQIIRRDLQPLGIDVQVKEFPISTFYDRISRRGEPFDLAANGWYSNTTDPAQNLEIFDGSTITADDNSNFSYLNDPAFDRQLRAAATLSGARRYRTYRQLDLELERDLAPAAAFATTASRDFFSARMGCQLYQPVYGIDLAGLCLRSTGS